MLHLSCPAHQSSILQVQIYCQHHKSVLDDAIIAPAHDTCVASIHAETGKDRRSAGGITLAVLQASSGFRNACVTDTGKIGGKLLAIVTPKGLHLAETPSASDLSYLREAYQTRISDRYATS